MKAWIYPTLLGKGTASRKAIFIDKSVERIVKTKIKFSRKGEDSFR